MRLDFREVKMENKFQNFNRAREEVVRNEMGQITLPISEKKQTYSFTLLPSEREMLKELAEQSIIKVSDSQFLGSLIREQYIKSKSE